MDNVEGGYDDLSDNPAHNRLDQACHETSGDKFVQKTGMISKVYAPEEIRLSLQGIGTRPP